jgi:hypothetical protein
MVFGVRACVPYGVEVGLVLDELLLAGLLVPAAGGVALLPW